MSTLKVDGIRSNSATSDAITLADNGTCTANITNNLSNRRLTINGAMTISQRGTSSTSAGYGSVDRFALFYGGLDEAPTHAQADVASGTTPYTLGFRKCLKITNGNQTSGAGASDYFFIRSKLEAQDIANSGWNYASASSYITLSFWVKSSVAQTFQGRLETQDGTALNFPFQFALAQNTWTKITKTIPGNSNLSFNNDVNNGLELHWQMFRGTDTTDNSVSNDVWATYSGTARAKDATSTFYTTNDATYELTGVQLEVGSVATDFEHRTFGQELSLCQRYYCDFLNYDGQGTNPPSNLAFAVGTWYNSSDILCPIRFPVPMRTAPSMESSNNTNDFYALYGVHLDYFNQMQMTHVSNMGARVKPNVGTANQGSSGVCTVLHVELAASAKLRFNAEL